jgi:molecular chaperone GrpE
LGEDRPPDEGDPKDAPRPSAEVTGAVLADADPSPEGDAAQAYHQRARLAEDRLAEVLAAYRKLKTDNEGHRERITKNLDRRYEQRRGRLLLKFIDILDNLDRALEAAQLSYAGEPLLAGMILVRTQLLQTLQDEGLERIPVLGMPFDPHVSESVGTQTVEDPEHDHVVMKEFMRGYRLHGRIARVSTVIIGVYTPTAEDAVAREAAPAGEESQAAVEGGAAEAPDSPSPIDMPALDLAPTQALASGAVETPAIEELVTAAEEPGPEPPLAEAPPIELAAAEPPGIEPAPVELTETQPPEAGDAPMDVGAAEPFEEPPFAPPEAPALDLSPAEEAPVPETPAAEVPTIELADLDVGEKDAAEIEAPPQPAPLPLPVPGSSAPRARRQKERARAPEPLPEPPAPAPLPVVADEPEEFPSVLNEISGEPDLELVVTEEELLPVPVVRSPPPAPRSRSMPVIAPASLQEPILELIPDDNPGELSLEEIIARAESQETYPETYDRTPDDPSDE